MPEFIATPSMRTLPSPLSGFASAISQCISFVCIAVVGLLPQTVSAATYVFNLDVSGISGAPIMIAFDFVDGGTPANSVVIDEFSTDGALGPSSSTGGVLGTPPTAFAIYDTLFFNEFTQIITGASVLSFEFTPSSNAPDAGSIPDTFSLFVLDPTSNLPLFSTTDPTGTASLFILGADGSTTGALSVYSTPPGAPPVNWSVALASTSPIPEPNERQLLVAFIVVVLLYIRRSAN